jgi:hypothetical protein
LVEENYLKCNRGLDSRLDEITTRVVTCKPQLESHTGENVVKRKTFEEKIT